MEWYFQLHTDNAHGAGVGFILVGADQRQSDAREAVGGFRVGDWGVIQTVG